MYINMDVIDLSKLSVIIVEDDAGGMAIISTFLRRLGIKTYQDKNGDLTVNLLNEMAPLPDVIFLDLKLPQKSGFDLLHEIRTDARFNAVKIIALTAMEASILMPKCQAAGFDGYIGKPLRREKFVQQIERIMHGDAVWDAD